jgi:hypothetical protein
MFLFDRNVGLRFKSFRTSVALTYIGPLGGTADMKLRSDSPSFSALPRWQEHLEVYSQLQSAKWTASKVTLAGGGFSSSRAA